MTRTPLVFLIAFVVACGSTRRDGNGDDGSTCPVCSPDNSEVMNCDGTVTTCAAGQGCSQGACETACQAAEDNHSSVGCDYYAVDMDAAAGPPQQACFAVFVANTSHDITHIQVEFNGTQIDLSKFAKLPIGQGMSLSYGNYDPTAGLQPGEVAILFLAYSLGLGNVACPVPAAIGSDAQFGGTGFGHAFHITTDMPVVAYQMLPYGGGSAAATGASLLLPTSAWHTNYIAVSAYDTAAPPIPIPEGPSYNFVGMEDNTTVTIRPKSAIVAGTGLPAGAANSNYTFTVNKGQHAQFTQPAPLSGSPVTSDKPIGVFGGHQIMSIDRCCGDHGEQMLTPVRALGYEYVAAPHGDRKPPPDTRVYRLYGAVDGTQLTFEGVTVSQSTLNLGDMLEVRTDDGPFVVRSQDADHPFGFFTYMTGAGIDDTMDMDYDPNYPGTAGDPDFVRLVPPLQYLQHYVFFTDVTYPFTTLTVVRQKDKDGNFQDVTLNCMGGPITTWQPVGTGGQYEIAFVKLVDHWNGQSGCNNGVNIMDSSVPFGVWVWGWGSLDTSTGWVSYGYPAGEGVLPINDVIIE
jgi:hypothetical protein